MTTTLRTWLRPSPAPRRARRGAAVAEFAITLPVMVAMLFATIEFGNFFSESAAVHNAVRDGARFGSNQPTLALAQTRGAAATRTMLSAVGYSCDVADPSCVIETRIVQDSGLNFLEVTANVPYRQITGVIPAAYTSDEVIDSPTRHRVVATYPIVGL